MERGLSCGPRDITEIDLMGTVLFNTPSKLLLTATQLHDLGVLKTMTLYQSCASGLSYLNS